MASNGRDRSPKRARKKERRAARREEWRKAVRRRRRQRWGVLLGSLGLIGVGLLIAFVGFGGRGSDPDAAPTPGTDDDTIAAPVREPVACDAEVPEGAGTEKEQYAEPTDQGLDPAGTTLLRLETSCGRIDIELDVETSPQTANSVAFLAREGFYDGLVFHRILTDFVIQGGDPQGDGAGGPGYDVIEPPPEDLTYEEGVVAMAKSGADPAGTSGSQFFIVTGGGGEVLPPEYAYVGRVVGGGEEAIAAIEELGSDQDGVPPSAWAYIESATIVES